MPDVLARVIWRWLWIGLMAGLLSAAGIGALVGSAMPGASTAALAGGTASQPVQFLAWVDYADASQLTWLANNQDIWQVDRAKRQALIYLTAGQAQTLRQAGYNLAVDLKLTQAISPRSTILSPQTGGIPNYPCYRTVEETYQSIQDMVSKYPTLAKSVVIGQSWDKINQADNGGYNLIALKLTNQQKPGHKPVLLVIGGIHAREYTTAELATRFAETLLQGYGTDPDITWLLDENEIDVIPQANPDGRKIAEGGVEWRKNRDSTMYCGTGWFGVDLNRNFDFKWGGAGQDQCAEDYQGMTSASEPETQALQAYIAGLFPARRGPGDTNPAPADYAGLLISLHSFGKNVLFPWGWTADPAPNQAAFNGLGQKFGFFNHYTVCQSNTCLYPTTGTTDEWAYATRGVPGFTFELGSTFFESCDQFASPILPDNLAALIYAAKTARLPYLLPAGPDTINPNAGSPDGATLTAVADDTRYAGAVSGAHAAAAIQASRYSIDTPAWAGGAIQMLAPVDGSFDQPVEPVTARIDLAGLEAGRHTVFVESEDTAGQWGAAGSAFIDAEYSLQALPAAPQFCLASTRQVELQTTAAKHYAGTIQLSLSGLPAGLKGSFELNPLAPGASTGLRLTTDGTTPPGVYPVTIQGVSGSINRSVVFQTGVAKSLPVIPVLSSPADGAIVFSNNLVFTWQAAAAPATYELQIARDAGFKQILADQTGLVKPAFSLPGGLSAGKQVYWRVRVVNPCGAGGYSSPAAIKVVELTWFPFVG